MPRLRCVLFGLTALGCARPQVVSLEAPDTACPGRPVEVQWTVNGRASLHVARSENDWDEGEVPSTGRWALMTDRPTRLTLTALEARPEMKNARRSRRIDVPRPADDRAAPATCDAAGHCEGSFELPALKHLRVVGLSEPTYRQGTVVQSTRVCVTAHGAAPVCVQPGASVPLDVGAGGTWTLQADLPPSAAPPELRIRINLRCL